MYGLWGFWGARYQSLRALIGWDASQPGQWATSVISSKKTQKGWITRGGGGSIYVYINQVHVYVCVYIHILTISVFSGYEVLVVKESGVTKGIISHWVFGPVVCNSCVAAHAPAHASFTCPYYRQNHANRKPCARESRDLPGTAI